MIKSEREYKETLEWLWGLQDDLDRDQTQDPDWIIMLSKAIELADEEALEWERQNGIERWQGNY